MILLIAARISTAEAMKTASAKAAKPGSGSVSGARIAAFRCTAIKSRMSEPVIELSLLLITEHIVGLSDLLKFLLRTGISGVGIRMILLRQLPVCFFDCIFISVLFDAKHFIIISLCCHICHLPISQPLLYLMPAWKSIFYRVKQDPCFNCAEQ